MRHQWRMLAAILPVGVILGIAIAGVPSRSADAPLRVIATSTTAAVATTTSTPPTIAVPPPTTSTTLRRR